MSNLRAASAIKQYIKENMYHLHKHSYKEFINPDKLELIKRAVEDEKILVFIMDNEQDKTIEDVYVVFTDLYVILFSQNSSNVHRIWYSDIVVHDIVQQDGTKYYFELVNSDKLEYRFMTLNLHDLKQNLNNIIRILKEND